MPNLYSLDVAYSSATITPNSSVPVAMAFGFAQQSPSSEGKGQTTLTIDQNSLFEFNIFDTASDPMSIVSVVISFTNKDSPGQSQSPFSTVSGSSIDVLTPSHLPDPRDSVGCNVRGTQWKITAGSQNEGYVADQIGNYGITVAVIAQNSSTVKAFKADPRIIVTGTNNNF